MQDGTVNGMERPPRDALSDLAEKVRACIQCGTCTGSCAGSPAMDHTPRELWRMVQFGMKNEIFDSRTFWLCSSCYMCTLRCPRGLPLTETMASLKRLATTEGRFKDGKSPVFYRTFLNVVRRYGRVREMELMARYFLALRSPITPLSFTPVGMKLLMRGKLSPRMPGLTGPGKLDGIYGKVRELEAGS